jgi:hypothetical protein
MPSSNALQPGDPRAIIRWTRRYARSRTISFLVQWVIIVTMVTVIGLAASLTNIAYRAHNTEMFRLSVVIMGLAMLAFAWFSVSRWSGELIWRITQWLYGEEGYVSYSGDRRDGPLPWWLTAFAGGLVVYHLLGALLVSFGYLPLYMMQPFSAAYMAPFLAVMIVYQRLGFWAWIWPALYAAHAILLSVGVRVIGFPRQWQLLDMVVPIFLYGLIAILVGHAFSRIALWKLKRLARTGLIDAPPEDDEPGGDGSA